MEICPPSFDLLEPEIFDLGWFALRWYAVAYIAGLMIGWRYMMALARRPHMWNPPGTQSPKSPFSVEQVDDLLIWATLGVIVGGRLGYVVFYMPDMIWERPQDIILGITDGGMAFHGGLIGVSLALFVYSRRQEIDLWRIADVVAGVRAELARDGVRVVAPLRVHRRRFELAQPLSSVRRQHLRHAHFLTICHVCRLDERRRLTDKVAPLHLAQQPILQHAAMPVRLILPVSRHFEHLVNRHVQARR